MKLTFGLFLLTAAWQDLKFRKISVRLCMLFGGMGILENLYFKETSWEQALAAAVTGFLLLFCSQLSKGEIGSGDGCFFIAAATYLGFWRSMALLLYGLIFCSACCMGMIVWGIATGLNVKKRRLPFLPFLVPAWLWTTILGI